MANRLGVFWNRCLKDQWADLFAVDLEGPHFNGLEGVYVVWHGGPAPRPVAIGAGRIGEELQTRRSDAEVLRFKELSLLTTWARVDRDARDGVVRFLQESLKPIVNGAASALPPVEVNLPGYPPLEGAPLASPRPEPILPTSRWAAPIEESPRSPASPAALPAPKSMPTPLPAKKASRLKKLFETLMAERAKAASARTGLFGTGGAAQDDGLVIDVVRLITQEAVSMGASDIHLEPQENALRVRFRIDGLLEEVLEIPNSHKIRIVSNIRVACGLDPEKGIGTSRPEDARMTMTVAGQETDVRLSTFPTPSGDKAVLRLIPRRFNVPRLDEIGLLPESVKRLKELIHLPQGMIIGTGPTGSGKSTTLYSILAELNEPHRNIVTLEDPIEKKIPGISQGMLQSKVGFTFSEGLRAILRQDPNVIMVGEIRDTETAEIAMRASLTGHMVLTTLHTTSALGAVARLLDMGLEPFLIASALTGVFAQRLARRVCAECAQVNPVTEEERAALAELARRHGLPFDGKMASLARGSGCAACRETGYKGRVLLLEIVRLSSSLRQMILKKASYDELRTQALREGNENLLMDGWRKTASGVTTIEELLRVADSSD